MKPRQICSGVQWMGAVDWNRRLFDSLIPLPDGTSYNAYLVQGSEKTALLDTVDPTMDGVLMSQLANVDHIDYVISQHAEQDHSGTIPLVLEKYDQAMVVCTPKARGLLVDHLGIEAERVKTVEDGETLSLGGKTLRFIYTPWVHWPETMVNYLVAALVDLDIKVQIFELTTTDIGQLAMALVDAATIVIGTPTIHAGPHPAVFAATHLANALRPKLKYAAIIGSYGWGTKVVEQVSGLIPNLKAEVLGTVLCKGVPRSETLSALDALAETIRERHALIQGAPNQ